MINCLAYVDLNPVRAGIVGKPEDYRWTIIGTKPFVSRYYVMFKGDFNSKNEKKPKKVKGFDEVYLLKRLSNEM